MGIETSPFWVSTGRRVLAAAIFSLTFIAPGITWAEELVAATDFVTDDAAGTHVMTFLVRAKGGEVFALHSHGGDGMVVVIEGEFQVTPLGGDPTTYVAGDTFMELKDHVMSATITSENGGLAMWTVVLPDGAELETPYSG